MATIRDILTWMNEMYPFALAEDYDNCGLLIGDPEKTLSRCLLALDVTDNVLADAVRQKAELILTHHPVIFNPLKRLSAGEIPYECARNGVAVLSSHTCLDKAEGGVNDVLTELFSLRNVTILEEADGVARMGTLARPVSPLEFAGLCKKLLNAGGVRVVEGNRPVKTVGICSGAGGDFLEAVIVAGCDAYLTGEVKHHEAVAAKISGITLVDAGHFETETVILPKLAAELSEAFPAVEFLLSEANRPLMKWM